MASSRARRGFPAGFSGAASGALSEIPARRTLGGQPTGRN
jgi:hypothetical protein